MFSLFVVVFFPYLITTFYFSLSLYFRLGLLQVFGILPVHRRKFNTCVFRFRKQDSFFLSA